MSSGSVKLSKNKGKIYQKIAQKVVFIAFGIRILAII